MTDICPVLLTDGQSPLLDRARRTLEYLVEQLGIAENLLRLLRIQADGALCERVLGLCPDGQRQQGIVQTEAFSQPKKDRLTGNSR